MIVFHVLQSKLIDFTFKDVIENIQAQFNQYAVVLHSQESTPCFGVKVKL